MHWDRIRYFFLYIIIEFQRQVGFGVNDTHYNHWTQNQNSISFLFLFSLAWIPARHIYMEIRMKSDKTDDQTTQTHKHTDTHTRAGALWILDIYNVCEKIFSSLLEMRVRRVTSFVTKFPNFSSFVSPWTSNTPEDKSREENMV